MKRILIVSCILIVFGVLVAIVVNEIQKECDIPCVASEGYFKKNSGIYYRPRGNLKGDEWEIKVADYKSFEIIDSRNAKDKNIFYHEGKVVDGGDVETMTVLHHPYLKDKYQAFYYGVPIQNVDLKSFDTITHHYAKDKNNVYRKDGILEGVDPANVKFLNDKLFYLLPAVGLQILIPNFEDYKIKEGIPAGSEKSYDFNFDFQDKWKPVIKNIKFSTENSLRKYYYQKLESCRQEWDPYFCGPKQENQNCDAKGQYFYLCNQIYNYFNLREAFLKGEKIENYEIKKFNDLIFYVQNQKSDGENAYLRIYTTFVDQIRIDVVLIMPDVKKETIMQADKIFSSFYLEETSN